tara:strand:+ start:2726 stop:3736 length:1011 start_codon:yes stop_codon:yes gene_type:complete
MVKQLFVNKILTDKEVSNLEGTWITEEHIKLPIIDCDSDVYYNDNGVHKLLLKFRKNVIDDELIDIGWKSYKDLAKASRGRGASAGPINVSGQYWSKRTLKETKKWSTSYLVNGKQSKMKVNNQVASNPVGFYEEMNNFSKLPCRLTHFTRTNFDKYNQGLPFIKRIDELFEKLIPSSHKKQLERALLRDKYMIKDTAFSTVTINRNFRTALHKDAGDYKEGFGNLTVIERGKYQGGYTVFPQFGVGIDLRNNDFVAMDVHQWHSNTKIYETEEDHKYNLTLPSDYKENSNVGTEGIYKPYTRLSFVCYLRENIIKCDNDNVDYKFLQASGHTKLN